MKEWWEGSDSGRWLHQKTNSIFGSAWPLWSWSRYSSVCSALYLRPIISVNGLSPGAPVKFKGIDIGKVTDISLSSKVYPEHHIGLFSPDSSVAVVRMIVYLDEDQLKKQLPSLIQNGLRFQTELAGVTGTIYLAANFLNPTLYPPEIKDVPWKPRYLYVPATISLTN